MDRQSGSSARGDGARTISRRRFVKGLAAGGVIAGLELWRVPAWATTQFVRPAVLSGNNFNLVVDRAPVNFTGRPAFATAVNGSVPGPLLKMREGDAVTISVANRLGKSTSIHWHGFRIPADMDGVPGLSYAGIAPGATFVYRFRVRQAGTYWYHAHSHFEEQTGLYGPIIIDPAYKDPVASDREYIVMLSDWSDQSPETIFANLKQDSSYYNYHQRTLGTFIADVRERGLEATLRDRLTWGRMNMSPTDILDVSGAAYTYLMNGRPPGANFTALFNPGERVRLRFINGSSMTIFDVRIPGLPMTVVQSDGNDLEPVTVDQFRISVAETYDVIVQPRGAEAFTIFAQAIDSTGYARGTLAPRRGMSAPIPPMDPRPLLTMADMGMAPRHGMNMAGMPGMAMHRGHGMAVGSRQARQPRPPLSKIEQAIYTERARLIGENAPGQPDPETSPRFFAAPDLGGERLPAASAIRLREGPQVDNIATHPTERLSEPGAPLNHNGRRVLAYSDLRARYRTTDPRPASHEMVLHLTGNMERFIWGFDGKKFSAAEPIRLKLGERVRFTLINDTMMAHPIHLHGMWSELENGQGAYRPYKHTVNVKPGERLSYLVSADAPGRWAYHCHLLYHMEAGMFRTVIVS